MPHMATFQTHIALALQLIALVGGAFLLNKAATENFFCKTTGKILGGLVVVISTLSIICISYLSIKACCDRHDRMDFMRGGMKQMGGWQHPAIDQLPPDTEGMEKAPPKTKK